jgi:CheY-like chemotaxis protein
MNIATLVDETCGSLAPLAHAKQLDFRWRVDPALDRDVGGDPLRVRQALSNLVGNALKFTSAGFVDVEVTAAGEFAFFAVSDSGPGIDEANVAMIFDDFVQGDTSTSRRFGGTGLGLAIARRLSAAMGGDVAVQSTPGTGSTFSFTVKLAEPPAPESVPVATRIAPPPSPPGAARAYRVLLVEDDRINQFVSVRLLEKMGLVVEVVDNGHEAVSRVISGAFDLVLMDCQMPELDGYEATRRVRAAESVHGRRVPIVALTANALSSDRARCLEAGMDDYLAKPLRSSDLQRVLGRWLAVPL